MPDVQIVLKDLPVNIHGFVCLGSDYEPIIVINSRLSREKQLLAYEHEIQHLLNGEMYDENYNEYGGTS